MIIWARLRPGFWLHTVLAAIPRASDANLTNTIMKNLFIAFFAAFALVACSDDDNSPSGNLISVEFDGQEVNFRNIQLEQVSYPAQGENPAYTEITVVATANGNVFSFFVIKGETGQDAVYDFSYATGNALYNGVDMQSNLVSNGDEQHLVGTFSGTMTNFAETASATIQITDGSFDIKY